jgi:hypothetical protein
MNKKQIRLTESDLKQIVKESVNKILSEAYGTSTNADNKKYNNLVFGDPNFETLKDANGDFDAFSTLINKIFYNFEEIIYEIDEYGLGNEYSKKLYNLALKGADITKLWKNKEIMKLGIQPDYNYDLIH